jgi:serine/threonine protein kinase
MPLSGGRTFAGYRIVRLLGSGGMGEVYLAEHPRLPRHNALKVLPAAVSADPDYRARFEREADLASKLWHPHIVSVHDRGEHEGQLWISMDYVDGVDAAHLLDRRYPDGMPADEALRVVTAVASALDYAHKQGLLHRDVKPANIMLTHSEDKDDQRILLADFGIARNIDDISGITSTNMTVGTVAYSAPEQLMGEDLDGRADQYSLAATAYHLLTGSLLFPHSNAAVAISRHLNAEPPRLSVTHPQLASLDEALSRALSKNPDGRFSRCQGFARALAGHSSGQESPSSVTATQPARIPLPPKGSRAPSASEPQQVAALTRPSRSFRLASAAAIATLVLTSVVALIWHPWNKTQPAATTTPPLPSLPSAIPTSSTAPSPPPPPPTFPANATDSLLLGPAEIINLTGSTGPPLEVNSSMSGYGEMKVIRPTSCSGIMLGADHGSDPNTGRVAVRSQTLTRSPTSNGAGPKEVEQNASVFGSADEARATVTAVEGQWRSCASQGVVQGSGEDTWHFNFSDVQFRGDVVTVSMAAPQIESGGRACQTAIGLRANVVIEAWTCLWADAPIGATSGDTSLAGDHAEQLVTAMLDRVKV